MNSILSRLFEPSTWAGLGVLFTAGANVFEPGHAGSGNWTTLIPAALASLIAIFVPEKKSNNG